jgi:ribonuclease J
MMLAGKLFAGQVELPRERFRELQPENPVRVGDFTITPFAVDHSIYGCLALLVEAEDRSILYSGDLRLHGRKPGMAKRLLEALANRSLDVLLMEGTHFGLPDGPKATEYELEDEIVNHVHEAPGLVLASFSPQHVDRLVAFIRAAKKTKRTFVADPYTAFVLHLIAGETPVPTPAGDEGLRVYVPQSLHKSADRRGLQKLLARFRPSRIEMAEITADPAKHLMIFRASMLTPDFGGNLPAGTVCLYSRWPGYLEQPDWREAAKRIEASGGKLLKVHTTGHILSADIARFVRSASPTTIVPVHTFEPEKFSYHFKNARLLPDGETWGVE